MNTLPETIYRHSIDLPEQAAREALDFVEFLRQCHVTGQSEQPEAASAEFSPIYQAFEEAGLVGCPEPLITTSPVMTETIHLVSRRANYRIVLNFLALVELLREQGTTTYSILAIT